MANISVSPPSLSLLRLGSMRDLGEFAPMKRLLECAPFHSPQESEYHRLLSESDVGSGCPFRHSATYSAPLLLLQCSTTSKLVSPLTAGQRLVFPTICSDTDSLSCVCVLGTDHQTVSLPSWVGVDAKAWTLARQPAASTPVTYEELVLVLMHDVLQLHEIIVEFTLLCVFASDASQAPSTVSVVSVVRPVTSQHAPSLAHRTVSPRWLALPLAPRRDRARLDPRSLAVSAASPALHSPSGVERPPTGS